MGCHRPPPAELFPLVLPPTALVFVDDSTEKAVPSCRRPWVVVVIVITVVNGQLTQICACRHSSAAATDPGIDLQRSLTIALSTFISGASPFGDDAI